MVSVWPLSVVKTLMMESVPSTLVSFVVREMATFLDMGAGMACTMPKTERATRATREMNIVIRVESGEADEREAVG